MKLRDFAFDSNNNAIVGATVEASREGSATTYSTTTDSEGAWEFTTLEPGTYNVEIISADGTHTAHRKGNVSVQAQYIVGLDGTTAPLTNESITKDQIKPNVVANSDVPIEPHEVEETLSSPNRLRDILGRIIGVTESAVGGNAWWRHAPISLTDLQSHASRHEAEGPDEITPAMIKAAHEDHSHEGLGDLEPHEHSGTDITSAVAEADYATNAGHATSSNHTIDSDQLLGIPGEDWLNFMGGSDDGAFWTQTGPMRFQIGSNALQTDSNGRGTIYFPWSFNTLLWLQAFNGDTEAWNGSLGPRNSWSNRFTFETVSGGTDTQLRVNWMAIGV